MRLSPQHHRYIYVATLCIVAAGLPFSHFLMSVGQLAMAANWLWEGNLKTKLQRLADSKPLLILLSLFALHLLGLAWTSDFDYAFKDLRIKLPLLLLPLLIGTSRLLKEREFKTVIAVFIVAVTVASLLCMGVFLNLTDHVVESSRDISIFISHIRFSLNICLALFFLAYFIGQPSKNGMGRILEAAVFLWLLLFLFILGSLTGLVIFGVVVYLLLLKLSTQAGSKVIRRTLMALLLLLVAVPTLLLSIELYRFFDVTADDDNLIQHTPYGEKYTHNPDRKQLESGRFVYRYIAEEELKTAWEARSNKPISGRDDQGQPLHTTLIRYMTSKGLKKDKDGMAQMEDSDIALVEDGVANVRFATGNFISIRLYQIIWEVYHYQLGNNPESTSVGQRFECWKTAFFIFKQNTVIGEDTGDLKEAYHNAYRDTETSLSKKFQLRAHNQFITMGVQFGLLGALWFWAVLLVPIRIKDGLKDYFFQVFFIIAFFSMMNEDTLETQAGVTFFAFFYTLLLLARSNFPIYWPAKRER